MHGGTARIGPASPSYKDGRYSRYLPKRLLDRYREAAADADLLALHDDIALIDARVQELLSRVDSGESGSLWGELRRNWDTVERSRRAHDVAGLSEGLRHHGELIQRGHGDGAAWAEIAGLIERRRRLVESERKRLVEAQQMISVEQALGVMSLLVEAVRRHVRDDAALRAITAEFARLTGQPEPPGCAA